MFAVLELIARETQSLVGHELAGARVDSSADGNTVTIASVGGLMGLAGGKLMSLIDRNSAVSTYLRTIPIRIATGVRGVQIKRSTPD